jgi:primary-amine oxidase
MQQKEASLAADPGSTCRHPLDPLSEAELATACDILKTEKQLGPDTRFGFVQLDEPAKAEVLS